MLSAVSMTLYGLRTRHRAACASRGVGRSDGRAQGRIDRSMSWVSRESRHGTQECVRHAQSGTTTASSNSPEIFSTHRTLHPQMPRSKLIVVPGLPHHITQRGNGRANVFDCDQDRVMFLDFIGWLFPAIRTVVMGILPDGESLPPGGGSKPRGRGRQGAGSGPIAPRSHYSAISRDVRDIFGRPDTTLWPWNLRTVGGRSHTSNVTPFARA
jgi:hypothetical protein